MSKLYEISPNHPYQKDMSNFSDLLQDTGVANSTYNNYMKSVGDFLSWLDSNNKKMPLLELPWTDLREYQKYLQNERHLKGNNVNQQFSAIKMFLVGIVERTWNNKAIPSVKYDTFVGSVPLESEVVTILSNTSSRRELLEISLLAFCGLRISELVRLRWEHIRRERGTLYIIPSKNRESREVPLPTKILKELEIYCRSLYPKQVKTNFIFSGRCENGSVSTMTIENHLNKVTKKLGWEDRGYTCHSMRRHFGCTYYLAHPDDLPSLASIMGHKNVSSTMIYIRLAAAFKSRTVDNERINAVFGKVETSWK